jgi:hypothetical protein
MFQIVLEVFLGPLSLACAAFCSSVAHGEKRRCHGPTRYFLNKASKAARGLSEREELGEVSRSSVTRGV